MFKYPLIDIFGARLDEI